MKKNKTSKKISLILFSILSCSILSWPLVSCSSINQQISQSFALIQKNINVIKNNIEAKNIIIECKSTNKINLLNINKNDFAVKLKESNNSAINNEINNAFKDVQVTYENFIVPSFLNSADCTNDLENQFNNVKLVFKISSFNNNENFEKLNNYVNINLNELITIDKYEYFKKEEAKNYIEKIIKSKDAFIMSDLTLDLENYFNDFIKNYNKQNSTNITKNEFINLFNQTFNWYINNENNLNINEAFKSFVGGLIANKGIIENNLVSRFKNLENICINNINLSSENDNLSTIKVEIIISTIDNILDFNSIKNIENQKIYYCLNPIYIQFKS